MCYVLIPMFGNCLRHRGKWVGLGYQAGMTTTRVGVFAKHFSSSKLLKFVSGILLLI
jgi:hypothetical protein